MKSQLECKKTKNVLYTSKSDRHKYAKKKFLDEDEDDNVSTKDIDNKVKSVSRFCDFAKLNVPFFIIINFICNLTCIIYLRI